MTLKIDWRRWMNRLPYYLFLAVGTAALSVGMYESLTGGEPISHFAISMASFAWAELLELKRKLL